MPSSATGHAGTRAAVVDIGSFVLPYDYHLIEGLSQIGCEVDFYGSRTRYNGEFLAAMAALPGVKVHLFDVSRTVAGRGRALRGYLGLLWALWRRHRAYDWVNLQFSGRWFVELPFFALMRERFIWTVHNAVPHGFGGQRYRPHGWMAGVARALWFPSAFSAEDFYRRYGEHFRPKGRVVQHGLLGLSPGQAPTPYVWTGHIEALAYWSTVKPYKGIELLCALAQRRAAEGGGLPVEVHGLWNRSLLALRDELTAAGAVVQDRYLSADELAQLLSRDLVFLLPYHAASQSGALYSLLQAGRIFLATDVGDLGAFLRRHGLEALILQRPDVASVDQALAALQAQGPKIVARLAAAQQGLRWGTILQQAGVLQPFDPAPLPPPGNGQAGLGGRGGEGTATPVPRVSVIMPCHNGERFLAEAVASVQAQTLTDWELLVVDNQSSDGSWALAQSLAAADPRIVALQCASPGAAPARNAALARARGRYIAFLDCDDAWLPGKLARQIDAMQASGAALCWSAYQVVDEAGQALRVQRAAATTTYDDHLAKRNVIGCQTVVYDSELLGRQPMPLIRMRQDYGLWARLIRLSEARGLPLLGLPDVLSRYRVHPAAMTRNKFQAARYQWRLYREVERLSVLRSARYFISYAVQALAERR